MTGSTEQYVIPSDEHHFIGRMYELIIVAYNFSSYDESVQYPDVKYVLNVYKRMIALTIRVESINHIGQLLWKNPQTPAENLPLSAFDYCNLIQDAFLMRTISVFDCCCLLANEVLELGIQPHQTNLKKIQDLSGNHPCCKKLRVMANLQTNLRTERNLRFHRGENEQLTEDDKAFEFVANFPTSVTGKDRLGREIDVNRSYKEAIGGMQEKFQTNVIALNTSLDIFYDVLSDEFDRRFSPKFRGKNGFGGVQDKFRSSG